MNVKRTSSNARRRASMFRDQSLTASFNSIGAAILSIDNNNSSSSIAPPAAAVTVEKALMKVLVVDDSDLNRKMICKALAATKEFHCEQAVDGSKAVDMVRPHLLHSSLDVNLTIGDDLNTFARGAEEAINNGAYDIILMDYQMPVMDGPTAIAKIRRLGYKGIVLGLTGNALIQDREVMLNSGADGVLVKPLNMQLFRQVLKDLTAK